MGTDLYREGMVHLERGEVEEGRRLLEEAWKAAPDSVEILHGLARALDLAGERQQAMELLEQAHALAPSDPGPACDLALLLMEHEQNTRVQRILAPVLEAHPEHPRANLHMALSLAVAEPARAHAYAVKALQERDLDTRRQAEALLRVLSAHAPN